MVAAAAAAAAGAIAQPAAVGGASMLLMQLNASKLMWGLAAVVVNIGSRFVVGDLTPLQQRVFSNPLFKRLAIFCMCFMATRDVLVSICLALAVLLVLELLLHEKSRFCLAPGAGCASGKAAPEQHQHHQDNPAPALLAPRAPAMVFRTAADSLLHHHHHHPHLRGFAPVLH